MVRSTCTLEHVFWVKWFCPPIKAHHTHTHNIQFTRNVLYKHKHRMKHEIYLRPGIGCTAQMVNSNVIWQIRCHVIAIRQSSAQLSIINNCNRRYNSSGTKMEQTAIDWNQICVCLVAIENIERKKMARHMNPKQRCPVQSESNGTPSTTKTIKTKNNIGHVVNYINDRSLLAIKRISKRFLSIYRSPSKMFAGLFAGLKQFATRFFPPRLFECVILFIFDVYLPELPTHDRL